LALGGRDLDILVSAFVFDCLGELTMSNVVMVKGPKPHAHTVWLYWGVFFVLIFFTAVTVWLAGHDFGKLNLVVTLLIAGTKAFLVMAFFMHLAFDSKFFAVVAGTSLLFLALFILFPILDLDSRADLDAQQINFLPRNERVYKHALDMPGALPLRPGLQDADKEKLIFIKPGEH
jgi:caa(3)-type oxidase subunit IV